MNCVILQMLFQCIKRTLIISLDHMRQYSRLKYECIAVYEYLVIKSCSRSLHIKVQTDL